jgi:4-hydroxybenzoate polyprenyltransferase
MSSASSYFKMMRVEDWIVGYFFIPLIGTISITGISPVLWITAIVSVCILAFGFVINNVADVEIDRQHVTKCEANKPACYPGCLDWRDPGSSGPARSHPA